MYTTKTLAAFSAMTLLALTATNANAQTYSTNVGGPIVDNNATGISSVITVPDNGLFSLNSVTITGLTHTWAGDLIITLTHDATTIDIIDRLPRTGGPQNTEGSDFNGDYMFVMSGGADIASVGAGLNNGQIIPAGTYNTLPVGNNSASGGFSTADGSYSSYAGQNVTGNWTLNISDREGGDRGSFTGWSFNVSPIAVPEAGTLALLLPGIALVGIALRRKK